MNKIFFTLFILSASYINCITTIIPSAGGRSSIWHDDGSISTVIPGVGGRSTIWNEDGSVSTIIPGAGGRIEIWD